MSSRLALLLLLLASLLSLPACKGEESKPAETTSGGETKPDESKALKKLVAADFVATIPAGYEAMSAERLAELAKQMGGAVDAVMTKPQAAPDHFVTSIVFTPVPSTEVNPQTVCAEVAGLMAQAAGAQGTAPKEVEYPFGKTCQFEMGDGKQQAIQTVVFVGKKFWTVTCNFDPRDEASPKECAQVLEGFASK